MSSFSLRSETEEVQKKVMETINEIKETKERNAELRLQLYNTLEMLGMQVDDAINCEDIGYTVKMVITNNSQIVKEDLEALGVAPEVIEKATKRWTSRNHMRLTPKKYIKDEGATAPKSPGNKTYDGMGEGIARINEGGSRWR